MKPFCLALDMVTQVWVAVGELAVDVWFELEGHVGAARFVAVAVGECLTGVLSGMSLAVIGAVGWILRTGEGDG